MAEETKKKQAAKKTSAKKSSSAPSRAARSSSPKANASAAKTTNAKKASQSRTRAAQSKTSHAVAAKSKNQSACKATTAAQRDCKLSDYDIISDILGSHKSLIKLYGTALCEIGSEDLRDIVSCQMAECAEDQFDAFNYMNARGMYPTEPAPVQKVKQARQKFSGSIKK